MYKLAYLLIAMFIVFAIALLFLTGCSSQFLHEPTTLDALIDATKALNLANTASAAVNPWAYPIGLGFTALIATLESFRRKERAGRKYAEQKLANKISPI